MPGTTKKVIEEIEHTADWAIRVRGTDLEGLFVNAAHGMFGLIAGEQEIEPAVERQVELEGFDVETLLVDWLSELLYLNEVYGEIYVDYKMDAISPTSLKGVVRGGPAERQEAHIKAVTFNELEIRHSDEGFETTIVFDL